MLHIYIDADACPVKDEVYKVARRYSLPVTLAAGSPMRIPGDGSVSLVVVGEGMDAADNWIANNAGDGDIVITADIPLAARCLEKGAYVLGPSGKPFTDDNIGMALASRNLMADLRSFGEITGGPPPLDKRGRSLFLEKLDEAVNAIRRR